MKFVDEFAPADAQLQALRDAYLADETACVAALIGDAQPPRDMKLRIAARARKLVEGARASPQLQGGLDAFLHEYALSSHEGVVLMCLAEALLRIPDSGTADRLIRDKMSTADWDRHLGNSESILVNASTWGLLLTGRVINWDDGDDDLPGMLGRIVARSGEPVIRQSMVQSMRIMARQFVMGRTIEEATGRAAEGDNRHYRYSYDMLGEAAHTAADAARYFEAYAAAISALGAADESAGPAEAPGISIKLSALHPRYEYAQRRRVLDELAPRLQILVRKARDAGIGLTIDAEEADRLELSLEVVETVFADPTLDGWEGFGLAVQAYQKRAPAVIDWLAALSRRHGRRMTLRLVKGAYWDSEIKRAQELGLGTYPVFTRKVSTDVSYIACAHRLFDAADAFYPQFATHNAHTVAAVMELAGNSTDYEFQRLHGMGEALYGQLTNGTGAGVACRVYAPVGRHEDLLPYLVRRLLENGANTSFVNRLIDETAPVEEIIADPATRLDSLASKPHPQIPSPRDIYEDHRPGAPGIDPTDANRLAPLAADMVLAAGTRWRAAPLIGGKAVAGKAIELYDPADRRRVVGAVIEAGDADMRRALAHAASAAPAWDVRGGEARADCLDRIADKFETRTATLMAMLVREAGKTIPDAMAELREAIDFCRYYAGRARADFAGPIALPGPTGESNEIALHGRGVFACISPWNFPLAIFTGQVVAALGAGNAVIAKPAEQTPLVAAEAVRLMHDAGVPIEALHLLPGSGATLGAMLVADPGIDGVVFTGSTETARAINLALAGRAGPIIPLIAETGGQNAMIVDSSALTEQVVGDAVSSAFHSAGQRCSALRVLFLQDDIADRTIEMLTGAMAELTLGDPALLSTDVGPVIDGDAREILEAHAARMDSEAKLLYRGDPPETTAHGNFFAPVAYEIERLDMLEREVFGPVLHVIRYSANRLDDVLADIRRTGYGLTLGIHSRIDATIRRIHAAMPVGNVYVNRDMVGAVVGVHPFGGEGLSGTGPKAGGPRYLHRFAVERTLSVNIVAMGGNAALLSLDDTAD